MPDAPKSLEMTDEQKKWQARRTPERLCGPRKSKRQIASEGGEGNTQRPVDSDRQDFEGLQWRT
jgi:hypothetical protein